LPRRRFYSADTGLIGPLLAVASNAADPAQRAQAARMLREIDVREALWDGPYLAQHADKLHAAMSSDPTRRLLELPQTIMGLAPVYRVCDAVKKLSISA
jgi:hypothetical protein